MKTYYEDPSSPLRTVDCEVPVAPEDELRFEQRADDERYAVLEPLANEEEERRERQTTQARQDQEQARWIRGARSPSETRTRLGSVLDGIPPDSERADRFRGIAAEHAKHTEKQISEVRERHEKRERGSRVSTSSGRDHLRRSRADQAWARSGLPSRRAHGSFDSEIGKRCGTA
jgi:hypothetical protein